MIRGLTPPSRKAPGAPARQILVGAALGLCSILAVAAALLASFVELPSAGARSSDPLPQILETTLDYCRRLEGVSLYFVCSERVEEREYSPPLKLLSTVDLGPERHFRGTVLEYDYQVIRSAKSFEEVRTLHRENGRARHEPNAPLKTRIFKHKYMIFGPTGLFGEFWKDRHSHTLLREERVNGEVAQVIEAKPLGPPEPNLVYGKAWVRKSDCAILKIEWDQRALGNFERVEKTARALGEGTRPCLSIVCQYGIEKNGIRFPDRLTIREDYESRRGILRVSETTVDYANYKFFTVETEVRY